MRNNIPFIFFGTSEFSVGVLEALKEKGYLPEAVVSTPDKPQGRKLEIKPTPTKVWASVHKIPVLQPEKLDSPFASQLSTFSYELFIVASYGKIIPEDIFSLPPRKTLNVHPSLLPRLRGASPIQNIILQGEKAGVTVIEINEEMDAGPIVAQETVPLTENTQDHPPRADILEVILARHGGELLARILPDWGEGKIKPQEQDHTEATYCRKIKKEDGEINLADDPLVNLRKVQAYSRWPRAYLFYTTKKGEEIRIIVKEAQVEDGQFSPTRVIPMGKKEMDWQDFLRDA